MSDKKIQFFFDSGFHLPKEHGFSVIFLCSVLIGIILSFQYPLDILGLILSLLFAFTIFSSNTSISLMVKTKFMKIHVIPVLLIGSISLALLLYKLIDHNILIFFVTGVFFIVWMILNFMNRGHTTEELVTGSMTLTLFVPLIFINSIDFHYMTDFLFIQMMFIFWLVAGFTTQLILYVQYQRRMLSLEDFAFIWVCFLVSLLPFYFYSLLALKTIIVLIEPSVFVTWLYLKKPELSDKPVFKKIGKLLTIRLLLYIFLLSFVTYFL